MSKLSAYTTVTIPGSSDYLFLHNSGISNSRISMANFVGGNNYSIQIKSGYGFSGYSNFVISGSRVGFGTSSPTEVVDIRPGATSRLYIDKTGIASLGTNAANYAFGIGSYNSNGGTNWGEFGIGLDESGNVHLQSFNSKHIIMNDYGNNIGFGGHPNTAFFVTLVQSIGPSSNNQVNFGSPSYKWLSGYFNYLDVVNLNVSGATTGIFPSQAGNSGRVLATNGSTLSWVNQGSGGSGSPGGPTQSIQFNAGSTFSGSDKFTYSSDIVTLSGNFNISGNINYAQKTSSGVLFISGANTLATSSKFIWNSGNSTLGIGNISSNAYDKLWIEGNENVGYGINLTVHNTASTSSFAKFVLRTNGGDDGIFFGNKQTIFSSYGINNGICMRPGTATQDLGLAAGNGNAGVALGPAIIIKPDAKIGIGNTTAWVANNSGTAQLEILPVSGTFQALTIRNHANQSVDMFRAVSGSTKVAIDSSGRLNVDTIIINSGISGAAYTWPMVYGWSFPSGVVSGTGINVSYEIPIIMPCVLMSGAYAMIRSKTAASGNSSGFVVDINYNGTSIWSVNSGNRLKMANNVTTGEQGSFDNTGVLARGGYLSLDFDVVPTGTYANDIVIELLTMAQK